MLDTDIGTDVDDAVALALALASPEVELTAVTTVSGDTRRRASIVARIFELSGRPLPVLAAGAVDPLGPDRGFLWLGHEGRGFLADDQRGDWREDAADAFADAVLERQAQPIAIGPLTNVARALARRPALAGSSLTLMGGVIGLNPELPPFEYNLGSDAEASLAVFDSALDLTLVPLDVTLQTFLTADHLKRLRRSATPLRQALCEAMEIWWPLHQQLFAGRRRYGADVVCFLHDPLTLAILLDRSFVTIEPMRLRAELADGLFRLIPVDDGRSCSVVTAVDAATFVEFLMERLLRL